MSANSGIHGLDEARTFADAFQRAGIFGIAGYFARQAHQHRSMANWAGSLAVQLQTLRHFWLVSRILKSGTTSERASLHGPFGEHPAMKGEPVVAPSAAALETAVGLAAKLTGTNK